MSSDFIQIMEERSEKFIANRAKDVYNTQEKEYTHEDYEVIQAKMRTQFLVFQLIGSALSDFIKLRLQAVEIRREYLKDVRFMDEASY